MSSTKTLAQFMGEFDRSTSFRKLVADQGENFEIIASPTSCGMRKMCYMNAAQIALNSDEYDYCQGYATSPKVGIPLEHAWLVRKGDRAAFCVTWEEGMTDCFGVVVNRESLRAHILKTKMWGIEWHCDAADFVLE